MTQLTVYPTEKIMGRIKIPPDKSISHRAIIFSSLAQGKTQINNFLDAEDTLRTVNAFCQMGIDIKCTGKSKSVADVVVSGRGVHGLLPPDSSIYCGNSGTTMRLIAGVLAAQSFASSLYGDESLNSRPMKRVTYPLRQMGADIQGRLQGDDEYPPLKVMPAVLNGFEYRLPVASAQVKSAVLLAALFAKGQTSVIETIKSRDHTERMFRLFKIPIKIEGNKIITGQVDKLLALAEPLIIPGDISSAAFFVVAATILKDSYLEIENIGINPTRRGIIDVLLNMGADIRAIQKNDRLYEPNVDLVIKSSRLRAVTVTKEDLPLLIDEVPILTVAATQAEGTTKICGGEELRKKETDRINSMVVNLTKMGADIKALGDDLYITGPTRLKAGIFDSFSDHRTAMSMVIAALRAKHPSTVQDSDCINTSFPSFLDIFHPFVKFTIKK
ncbi:MAG: 3-phosphoshikimate 1-carboxyvinyltransferase [Candidatus Omnitrophota bacterium]